jgi:hypothetical protein
MMDLMTEIKTESKIIKSSILFYKQLYEKCRKYIESWCQSQYTDKCVQFGPLGIRNDHLGSNFFIIELSIFKGFYCIKYIREKRIVYFDKKVSLEKMIKVIQAYLAWGIMEYKTGIQKQERV